MHEYKFYEIAITQNRSGFGEGTLADKAAGRLTGCVGFDSDTKIEYLNDGSCFLEGFEKQVNEAIKEEKECGDNNRELIQEFKKLLSEFKQINSDVFMNFLSEDWDERYEIN
jgi:hypothetical protein